MDDKKRKAIGNKMVRGIVKGARGIGYIGGMLVEGAREAKDSMKWCAEQGCSFILDNFFIFGRNSRRGYDNEE